MPQCTPAAWSSLRTPSRSKSCAVDGNNVFSGGFLGLDNIGVFDRSSPLPTGGQLEQSDGTAWMAFFASMMLQIAVELALDDNHYEAMALKYFEHFLWIASAMDNLSGHGRQDLGSR